jgi:hypothetical protein
MTATTQLRMNVALALAVPAAGLVYLTAGDALSFGRFTIAAIVALGALWLTATAAVNTIPHPRPGVVQARGVATDRLPRGLTPASATYVDVSRPVTPWRRTNVLLAPLEALALAWSVPFLILLVMVPLGLALASALWFGRLILRP